MTVHEMNARASKPSSKYNSLNTTGKFGPQQQWNSNTSGRQPHRAAHGPLSKRRSAGTSNQTNNSSRIAMRAGSTNRSSSSNREDFRMSGHLESQVGHIPEQEPESSDELAFLPPPTSMPDAEAQ